MMRMRMRFTAGVLALCSAAACGRGSTPDARSTPADSGAASTAPAKVAVDSAPAATPATPVPAPSAGPAPGSPLVAADFVVRGLTDQMDSARVRSLLGAPDSTRSEENPFDPGSRIVAWLYPGMEVTLVDGNAIGITLTGPAAATARGLRPGDSEQRMTALYGATQPVAEDTREYPDSGPDGDHHVMRVTITGGRVQSIYLGWILD